MSPASPATPLPHLVDDLSVDDFVSLQPVDAHGVMRGDPIGGTVQDVARQDVLVDRLGAMLRLEGRLYLSATGEAFDLIGVRWGPGRRRHGVPGGAGEGVLVLDEGWERLSPQARKVDLTPLRDWIVQDHREPGVGHAFVIRMPVLSEDETETIESWHRDVQKGGRR
jgi:hypothetical protein